MPFASSFLRSRANWADHITSPRPATISVRDPLTSVIVQDVPTNLTLTITVQDARTNLIPATAVRNTLTLSPIMTIQEPPVNLTSATVRESLKIFLPEIAIQASPAIHTSNSSPPDAFSHTPPSQTTKRPHSPSSACDNPSKKRKLIRHERRIYNQALEKLVEGAVPVLRSSLKDSYDTRKSLKDDISAKLKEAKYNYIPDENIDIGKPSTYRKNVNKRITNYYLNNELVTITEHSSSLVGRNPSGQKQSMEIVVSADDNQTRSIPKIISEIEHVFENRGRSTPNGDIDKINNVLENEDGRISDDGNEDSVLFRIEPREFRNTKKQFPGAFHWVFISGATQVILVDGWIDAKAIIAHAGLSTQNSPGKEVWKKVKDHDYGETKIVGLKELYITYGKGIELANDLNIFPDLLGVFVVGAHMKAFKPSVWRCAERSKHKTSTFLKLEEHMKRCYDNEDKDFFGCVCATYFNSESHLDNHQDHCQKWGELGRLAQEFVDRE